jgi:hypothetical protein
MNVTRSHSRCEMRDAEFPQRDVKGWTGGSRISYLESRIWAGGWKGYTPPLEQNVG